MATTSSLGVGTGVDLQSMLTKILAAERAPITAIDTKITAANTKISLYGTLKSKLDALQTAADTLQFPARLSATTAVSSDSTIATASASHNTPLGSYSVEVTQLASAQKSFSAAYNAGTTFGQGTLNFTVSGVAATPINLNGQASYTLDEVGTQINNAKIGVTATVITTSTGQQRMVLTGQKSGANNSFQLTSTLTASGAQDSLASFDMATVGLLRATAQDGKMKFEGIEISSGTNSFTTGANGLTFTGLKLGTANVSVQTDGAKIVSAAQAFVESYNAVATFIKSNSGYDAATKKGQPLSADSTTRSVLSALGKARTTIPGDLTGNAIKTLSELGISVQQSGLLTLDTTKLNKSISASATDVVKALNSYGASFSAAVLDMQATGGVVSNRLNNLNASVSRFKDSQAMMETRVSLIEKRYRAQFIALDKLVSSLKTTSEALAQQLAGLQA